jgi:ubiquinone/menaquinone biosynthesis C-methylase UbiE
MKEEKNKKDLIWLRQSSSFAVSRIILTANKYRLFDYLDSAGKTASSLSKTMAADFRATELLLDSLVAIGLLEKKNSVYRNTSLSSRHLVKGKPEYQGDILRHYNTLWNNWSGLDSVLETGRPCKKSHDHKSFILGMHNLASLKVRKVMDNINLKGVKRLLDLGGGPGTYSIAFAKKKINVTLIDYPETLKISKKLIKEAGLEKIIILLSGDFTRDNPGNNYDLIFISQIFHAYSENECLEMLRKSFDLLNSDGRVVIQEFYLDETRTSPPAGAIFAINMLVNTKSGRTYTSGEISSWMIKTGFSGINKKIIDDTVLITGTKKC